MKYCPNWVGTFTSLLALSGSIVFALSNKQSLRAICSSEALIPVTIVMGSKWASKLWNEFELWVFSLYGKLPSASESLSLDSFSYFSCCKTLWWLTAWSVGNVWPSVICSQTSVSRGFCRKLSSSISGKSLKPTSEFDFKQTFSLSLKSYCRQQMRSTLVNPAQRNQDYAHRSLKIYILMLFHQDYWVNFFVFGQKLRIWTPSVSLADTFCR